MTSPAPHPSPVPTVSSETTAVIEPHSLATAMDYSNGLYDCQSPTSPFLGGLRVLHLLEDLRGVLELMDIEERDNLRCQIPDSTADGLAEWLQGRLTNGHGPEAVYQERLSRLESDKECLVLQVSVLTDQVEVQGEKIRDLDTCLDHHRQKLNATEELLQQELSNRTTLETQKLELMTEVSSLRLKLTAVERDHRDNEVRTSPLKCHVRRSRGSLKFSAAPGNGSSLSPPQGLYQEVTDLRFRVTDIENERLQCEKKLKVTKVSALKLRLADASFFDIWLLKRSHSSSFNLNDDAEMEFRRGGVRATAGPRLGWSRESKHNVVDVPFSHWSKDEVCAWLHQLGLGLYIPQGQSWIKSGQTLLRASQHDLEKELCMKHPLHRKKLQLALQALGSEEDDLKGRLDHNWVTRWLDDIGLPQYKSYFDEARVDGCMLHYMTVEDLLSLKVGSVLHHLGIKRAIQVLRLNCYEPNCLRRRPSDENNMTPAEISQWTNHRVMEWLRSVDLAEYAPNLRGSGVHGGLMVLEPRFNVEALALLLNIPPNKTLLRRHLATHFHLLIGSEAQRLKQDCLENPDYIVLTATAKVKPRRLSFGGFGTLRKKRHDDADEYVCPMNVEMPKSSSFQAGVRIYEEHLDHLEQMEDSEGTVRQIGAFSEEINNLTSDSFLNVVRKAALRSFQ
uniref:PPFIA binding protein 1 n=1 Tax=Cyclopterus lumpus TaxID=8103 RepID=A0A8C3B0N9_CYCLU